ncbi:TPA: hypothetical protein UL935_002809 [Stenotrophomonas maltophilia]|nr:hypothetical protein [Stenotrophomonas maltophilia]
MSSRLCQFIDLLPDVIPALILGAEASMMALRDDVAEALAELDAELTPSQLVDLAQWATTYFAETGKASFAHEAFWEQGITLKTKISSLPQDEIPWQWVQANVDREFLYFARVAVVWTGCSPQLLVTDVYRFVASTVYEDRARSSLTEIEEFEVDGHLSEAWRAAALLFEASDSEVRCLKFCGSAPCALLAHLFSDRRA